MTSAAADRLLAPYRPVRRVGATDVPWAGMLVRLASGESRVLVDAQGLGRDWEGWRADPEGHLLAPLDIVRHGDGHDVALPLCAERVEEFLARRDAARVPLSIGETVTVAVSLIRGVAALDTSANTMGEWWLTDAGRPVLATDTGDAEAAVHTAELLRSLADASPHAGVLHEAAEAVAGVRRTAHDFRIVEEHLFALASPEPLATSLLGPRAARDLFAFDREAIPTADEMDRASSWVDAIARHVDADLADAVSRATTGVWRRLRRPQQKSRKPWLYAGCAAAAVLVVGLMWPTGAGRPATADVPAAAGAGSRTVGGTPSATAHGSPSATADGSPSPAVTGGGADTGSADDEPEDLVDVTNRLLDSRSACAGDRSCLAAVIRDPGTQFEAGAIDLGRDERATTLLDDFGGVAVLRVDALDGGRPSQLVVVMLQGDRWLLRDVHAAKQP
ncbi:hypothetical protein [Microbacterium deminutum]|uniref:Uncharacterized protein n=1 Tax=Microbacterium deminutum TaxID=344164 RepID=A0ABN2QFZ9_9MICO